MDRPAEGDVRSEMRAWLDEIRSPVYRSTKSLSDRPLREMPAPIERVRVRPCPESKFMTSGWCKG